MGTRSRSPRSSAPRAGRASPCVPHTSRRTRGWSRGGGSPKAPPPPRKASPGTPWARVNVLRDLSKCLNCGTCIDSCMYGVHDRKDADTRFIDEPEDHLCRVCFRCVAECPVNALSLERNVEFTEAGNGLFKPELLRTIANEAEAGRIPVTGACYRGAVGGQGVGGVWAGKARIVGAHR